ncbi:MAG: YihA family ribosome biogenesis GTP-binding protein [Anaerotignum sp.]|nr:YihA family ribosome biogenesis GTP-binding protein [Anaerotignum sp.]
MEVKNSSLAYIGTNFSHYPQDGKPEIAFAGKSNVGKSTLINAILGRRALARTSSQPGKTRTINFYDVNGQMYVVDLPGYGYAKAPKTEIAKWGQMIEEYLGKREELRAIILLIDIRHEPGKNDMMMYDWLKHYGYDIIIAATKADKINRSQIQKHLSVIRKALGLRPEDVLIPFSGEKKTGVEELWAEIERFLPETEEM